MGDKDVKEFAVSPTGVPSASNVVITVIPVAKQPTVFRNSFESTVM